MSILPLTFLRLFLLMYSGKKKFLYLMKTSMVEPVFSNFVYSEDGLSNLSFGVGIRMSCNNQKKNRKRVLLEQIDVNPKTACSVAPSSDHCQSPTRVIYLTSRQLFLITRLQFFNNSIL